MIKVGNRVIHEAHIVYIEEWAGELHMFVNAIELKVFENENRGNETQYVAETVKLVFTDPVEVAGLKNWFWGNAVDVVSHAYASPDPRLSVSSGVQQEARNLFKKQNGIPEEA